MASASGQAISDTDEAEAGVRAVRTRPGRLVFTEVGRPDAWIATDLFVDLDSTQE